MRPDAASASVAALAVIEERATAAQRLASQVGADALVLLVHNPQIDRLLPAAGMRKTLPGGATWQDFVARCAAPGLHRGAVTALDGDATVLAAACSNGQMVMLFLGGEVSDSALEALLPTLPLLAALLQTQQSHGICVGELSAAQFEMRQYKSLTRALDEARSQLDATVRELGVQARRLEEQHARAERATRAKDQFLAMLGHELRNPLAPIVTVLQVLRMRGQWSPEHAIMQRQVDHLQRLVDDLLDVARIAGGKLVLDRRVIEVSDAIRTAHETAHPLIAEKRQRIELQLPSSGLPVHADPTRLAQVFANLLTNASKYSDPGSRIIVRARPTDGWVVVEVIDNGAGIAPAMLDRVFDLFEQESSSLDRAQGGLGLGLAIVRNLVQQHGGSVRVHSVGLGHGSRFVIQLPLAIGQPETVTSAPEQRGSSEPVTPRRILLVDDNADALTTLSQALRLVGFSVEIAGDGPAALELAQGFRPELAVLDIGLPGMDGYQLAGELRKALGNPRPKLVALTGYGQPGEKEKALEAGFDAHLIKPVDFERLHRLIDDMLDAPAA